MSALHQSKFSASLTLYPPWLEAALDCGVLGHMILERARVRRDVECRGLWPWLSVVEYYLQLHLIDAEIFQAPFVLVQHLLDQLMNVGPHCVWKQLICDPNRTLIRR